MLALYVAVLNSVCGIGRGGGEPTVSKVANECGISYYKAKSVLEDLEEFGMVFRHMRTHRPNVMKSVFIPSTIGTSWVQLMNLARSKGF